MGFLHRAALLAIMLACSGQENSDWLALLSSSPKCTHTSLRLPPAWTFSPLGEFSGEIRLPATFHPLNVSGDQTLWIGPDSSDIAYFESAEPGTGLMMSGSSLLTHLRRPSYSAERPCRFKVEDSEGVVMMFQHVDSARTDTVFGFATEVQLSRKRYAQTFAQTPTTAMRDSLLSAVASLRGNSK
jgi:hypothetical protein